MSTQRKNIRKKIVALLKLGETAAGTNVASNRSWPAQHEGLPALSVMTRDESHEEYTQAPLNMKRALNVEIEAIAEGFDEDEAGDRLDDLCQQVDNLLFADDSLGKTCEYIRSKSIGLEFRSEGERVIAAAVLRYEVAYLSGYPETRFDQEQKDLTEVNADWNIGNETVENAKNKIVFP